MILQIADCRSDLISLVSRNVYRADVAPKTVKRKTIYYGYFYEQLRSYFGLEFLLFSICYLYCFILLLEFLYLKV